MNENSRKIKTGWDLVFPLFFDEDAKCLWEAGDGESLTKWVSKISLICLQMSLKSRTYYESEGEVQDERSSSRDVKSAVVTWLFPKTANNEPFTPHTFQGYVMILAMTLILDIEYLKAYKFESHEPFFFTLHAFFFLLPPRSCWLIDWGLGNVLFHEENNTMKDH